MPQDDKGYFYYTVRTKEKSFDDWIRKQASDNDCSINTYVKMVLNKERNANKNLRTDKSN